MNFDVLFFSGHELGVFCLHRFAFPCQLFFSTDYFKLKFWFKKQNVIAQVLVGQTFLFVFLKKNTFNDDLLDKTYHIQS